MLKEGGFKILDKRKRQRSLQGAGKYATRKSEVSWGERSKRQNQPQREGMNGECCRSSEMLRDEGDALNDGNPLFHLRPRKHGVGREPLHHFPV